MNSTNYNAVKKLIEMVSDEQTADHYIEKINDKKVLEIKFQTGGTATTEKMAFLSKIY